MKPIETRYSGYRFRSRLEARWAVFFDAMAWAWRYEADTYNVPGIGWYLPDFVLDDGPRGLYEIKPVMPSEDELLRAEAVGATILVGEPFAVPSDDWPFSGVFSYIGIECLPDEPEYTGDGRVFCECRYCSSTWWMGGAAGHEFLVSSGNDVRDASAHVSGCCACNDKIDDRAMAPSLLAAYQLARSARFENGDTFDAVVDTSLAAYRECRRVTSLSLRPPQP